MTRKPLILANTANTSINSSQNKWAHAHRTGSIWLSSTKITDSPLGVFLPQAKVFLRNEGIKYCETLNPGILELQWDPQCSIAMSDSMRFVDGNRIGEKMRMVTVILAWKGWPMMAHPPTRFFRCYFSFIKGSQ